MAAVVCIQFNDVKKNAMKFGLLSIFACLFLLQCNTKTADKEAAAVKEADFVIKSDSPNIKTDEHYLWEPDPNAKKGITMIRTRPISKDSLTVSAILNLLNETYPEIKLDSVRQSQDTVFIAIRKSTYLTRQMGSYGADSYLAEVTYNLTEISGVNFVDIRFKEGEHASPGTYSRTDFVSMSH